MEFGMKVIPSFKNGLEFAGPCKEPKTSRSGEKGRKGLEFQGVKYQLTHLQR